MLSLFKTKASFDEEVSRHTIEACELIIKEMGAEIHDDLIQRLSIFRLYLDKLERSKSNPVETENIILRMNNEFQEITNSVRRISRHLLPIKMEGDTLQKRIAILCQNLERPEAGTIHFEHSGNEITISEVTETYLYRITQELIHNALKHSLAWHIWVRVIWEDRYLTIEVEDDGTSFSRISEFMIALRKKHNTLRMRSKVIGAKVQYLHGNKGLLAKVKYTLMDSSNSSN